LEFKKAIIKLREQLEEAGIEPIANDPHFGTLFPETKVKRAYFF